MQSQRKHYLLFIIVLGVLLVSGLSYFIPVASGVEHVTEYHWRMVQAVAMATLICSAAVLFLKGLSGFKSGLRIAYGWFAGGMILFGVALLQWPVTIMLGPSASFWINTGSIIVPFIIAAALTYTGMRKFVKLLEIRTVLSSLPLAVTSVLVFALLSGVLSYFISTSRVQGFDTVVYTATVGWGTGYALLTWLLVRKVQKVIGAVYRAPMKWLSIALALLTASSTHEYVRSYFMNESDWYLYTGLSQWPFVVTGFFLVWAAHRFDMLLVSRQPSNQMLDEENIDRAFIDGITSIASLASRPEDIDATLDGLRVITAGMQPDVRLSESEQDRLVNIYLKLEKYLTTSDPLRTYSKEQLRADIAPAFRVRIESASITEQN